MMNERTYTFIGGQNGAWEVTRLEPVIGPALEMVSHLDVQVAANDDVAPDSRWALRGVTSNGRYTTRQEHEILVATQAPIGRPDASCAALIPLSKSPAWWNLTQDERREVLEERSHHIATGMRYLPAIARRLHHGRDLGEVFDFLTWFEYAPGDANAFEELVALLRATEEWNYVEREVDIRLIRKPAPV